MNATIPMMAEHLATTSMSHFCISSKLKKCHKMDIFHKNREKIQKFDFWTSLKKFEFSHIFLEKF